MKRGIQERDAHELRVLEDHPEQHRRGLRKATEWCLALALLCPSLALAQGNDACFVSQSVPTAMQPGQNYLVTVTFRNCGTSIWDPGANYFLGSQRPANNWTWGLARASLGGLVAPGEEHTFSLAITAPAQPGTYDFQWQMVQEFVEFFGDLTPNVPIFVGTPVGTNGAQFISQSVPTAMEPGQTYVATVTFRNSGTSNWDPGANYFLGSQRPANNWTWGLARVSLGGLVAPGQDHTFSFTITAPSQPGTYDFQWQMVQEFVEFFGDLTPNVPIFVGTPVGTNGAQFISQSVPTTMEPGQTYVATVTFRNSGTSNWDPGANYFLGSQRPANNWTWGLARVSLGGLVAPGQDHTFSFTITAPSQPGTYDFEWQMVQEWVEWFGDLTPNVPITVGAPGGVNGARIVSHTIPFIMFPTEAAEVSITVENTGSTTWDPATHFLGAVDNVTTWGLNRVSLDGRVAPGKQKVFTFKITAPSAIGFHGFRWRMVEEYVEWFGESTPDWQILVWWGNHATFVSQSVPPNLLSGQTATVSVTMENTGYTVWDQSTDYFLGSSNPQNNQVWGLARVAPSQPVAPSERTTFTFTITAPSTPGRYDFQWQMLREYVEWFGTPTPNVVIQVGSPDDMAVPVRHTIPESMPRGTPQMVSVTMQNTGISTWSRDGDGPPDLSQGFKLAVKGGSLIPVGTRYLLPVLAQVAPQETYTFEFTITPPDLGFATAELQMIHEGSGWFGEVLHVGVAIDGQGFCTLNLDPPHGSPGTLVTVTPAGCTLDQSTRLTFSFGDPEQHAYSLVPVQSTWLSPTQMTFAVPLDAGCGSHYASVKRRPLDPRRPAEFDVTGPCDPSRRNSFDVLTYNVHLLQWPASGNNDYRAHLIADHPDLKPHDAIVFVEAISDHRWILINNLGNDYPYFTLVVESPFKLYNGGVFIMSKWPIEGRRQIVFDDCNGDLPDLPPDCLAAKGVSYARINKAGQPYHVLGTHFDAGFESGDYSARRGQTEEMAVFNRWEVDAPVDEPVIMAGDFNIDKRSANPARQAEYAYLLDTLDVTAPSSDPWGTNPQGEWIDYVLYSNAHLLPRENFNHVLRPRDGAGGDLSDHYAVLGRFRFSPPTITRPRHPAPPEDVPVAEVP